jgi:hypothetical protein
MSDSRTDLRQMMLPQYQLGMIVRKIYNASTNRWEIAFGVRDGKQEIMLGFTFSECEQLVRTMIGVMDTFTPEQKRER